MLNPLETLPDLRFLAAAFAALTHDYDGVDEELLPAYALAALRVAKQMECSLFINPSNADRTPRSAIPPWVEQEDNEDLERAEARAKRQKRK